jgi:hypothetical protein
MACHHKLAADFKELGLWKCSACGHRGKWSRGWQWFGRVECLHCGCEPIESVLCPKCSVATPR